MSESQKNISENKQKILLERKQKKLEKKEIGLQNPAKLKNVEVLTTNTELVVGRTRCLDERDVKHIMSIGEFSSLGYRNDTINHRHGLILEGLQTPKGYDKGNMIKLFYGLYLFTHFQDCSDELYCIFSLLFTHASSFYEKKKKSSKKIFLNPLQSSAFVDYIKFIIERDKENLATELCKRALFTFELTSESKEKIKNIATEHNFSILLEKFNTYEEKIAMLQITENEKPSF